MKKAEKIKNLKKLNYHLGNVLVRDYYRPFNVGYAMEVAGFNHNNSTYYKEVMVDAGFLRFSTKNPRSAKLTLKFENTTPEDFAAEFFPKKRKEPQKEGFQMLMALQSERFKKAAREAFVFNNQNVLNTIHDILMNDSDADDERFDEMIALMRGYDMTLCEIGEKMDKLIELWNN